MSSGTVNWITGSITPNLPSGTIVCVTDYLVSNHQFSILYGGKLYPTCINAGSVTSSDLLSANNYNPGSVWNKFVEQDVLKRNNWMAKGCPGIQTICAANGPTSGFNDWSLDLIQSSLASLGVTPTYWRENICLGDDNVVRYITASGIVNTCTGYEYVDNASVRDGSTNCEGVTDYDCGNAVSSNITKTLIPGYPGQQFPSIARAIASGEHVLPECSMNNNNFCGEASVVEVPHVTYGADSCITEGTYYSAWELGQLNSDTRLGGFTTLFGRNGLSVCIIEHSSAFVYGIIDDGVVYPTCMGSWLYCDNVGSSGNANIASCPSNLNINNIWTILQFYVLSRANYMHFECPSITNACNHDGLTSYQKSKFSEGVTQATYTTDDIWKYNLCIGTDNTVRVATREFGIVNTCVGFKWDGTASNPSKASACPAKRRHLCGTTLGENFEKVYGWPASQYWLVQNALGQSDFKHPHCPYQSCVTSGC